jgi:hypothetical protein
MRRFNLNGHKKMSGKFIVKKIANGKEYIMSDYNAENNAVVWSTDEDEGIIFRSADEAKAFIRGSLNGRTDVVVGEK